MDDKRVYEPLNEKEKDFCDNQIECLPYIGLVVDNTHSIVYLNTMARTQLPVAHMMTDLYANTGYLPESGKIEVRDMYGSYYLVSSLPFKADERDLFLVALLPEIILSSGEYVDFLYESEETITDTMKKHLEYVGENELTHNKLARFANAMSRNYDRNDSAKRILRKFMRDHTMIVKSAKRICNLDIVLERLENYTKAPLENLGMELEITKDSRELHYHSLIEPKMLLYAMLCIVNFCMIYADEKKILLEVFPERTKNVLRFSIQDKYNALEVFNGFFLKFPELRTLYSLSYAFTPFAITNAIIERFGYEITYQSIGKRLFISIRLDRSSEFPMLWLRDPAKRYDVTFVDSPEMMIYNGDELEKAKEIIDWITEYLNGEE